MGDIQEFVEHSGRAKMCRFRKKLKQWLRRPPDNLAQRMAACRKHARQADTKALLRCVDWVQAPGICMNGNTAYSGEGLL